MGRIGRIIRPQTYICSEPTPPRSSPELLRARRYAPTALLRLLVRKTSKKVIEGVPQMACCSLAVAEGGIVVHEQIRHGQQNRVRANYESEYQWPHMISSACCGRATAGLRPAMCWSSSPEMKNYSGNDYFKEDKYYEMHYQS
jgi:hypothetical protein